jgi:NAD(P)-dependent dehydrogenase (short-subunit alcohol dehydrogenase family)
MSIGRAIALGLADAGADVAIQAAPAADAALGLTDAAEQTRLEIIARGAGRAHHRGRFRDDRRGCAAVRDAEAVLGGLDILVICASMQRREAFSEITAAEIGRQVGINFRRSPQPRTGRSRGTIDA